jgi:FMN-dependent NADH-azoreductase
MGSDLNQQSLERMLEAIKTDFVDRGKMVVVRPTKMLVTPEQYSQWCDAFGRAGRTWRLQT